MQHKHEDGKSCCGAFTWDNIVWWAKLVVAVIAIPLIGVIVGSLVPGGELGKTAAFILTCWVCVFLGMKLMANPDSK